MVRPPGDGELIREPGLLGHSYWVTGLNNRDQVTFRSTNPSESYYHGGIWDIETGDVTDLGQRARSAAMNDRGMVVVNTTPGVDQSALWHNGKMTDLGTLGGNTTGSDINERGQIVGTSTDADGQQHAFLWDKGKMTQIDSDAFDVAPEDVRTVPSAINNRGQVVGEAHTPDFRSQAFLWQDGQTTNLGKLVDPDQQTTVEAISDHGQILGTVGDWDIQDGEVLSRPRDVLWTARPRPRHADGL